MRTDIGEASHLSASSELEEYDLLILGSGEGSKYLAWTFANRGQRVAVVDRKYVGGSCPNIACLPSKNIIHSAKVVSYFHRGQEFGVALNAFTVDMSKVRDRKRKMVAELVDMHLNNFEKSGAELILGHGRFIGPRIMEVATPDGRRRTLRGATVIIGTGTRATIGLIPGLIESQPLTHVEALELDEIPEHLLILGGGYVGLEFAQAMRRMGSRVTILERNMHLAHREDADVSESLETLFRDDGIEIVFNVCVKSVSGKSGHGLQLHIEQDGSERMLSGTHLLVATGRTPNTEDIGLELAGVALTAQGYVEVDEQLRTTSPKTWAAGDVTGGPQFTHIAFDDFRVIRDNLLGKTRVTTGRQVPYCLFTDPELARIGLNEREAKKRGLPYRLFKIPMNAILRTRTLSETRGFMKALVGEDDKILGFTAFGVNAGELMGAIQIAMIAGLPYTALREAIMTHPTLMEGLVVLFSSEAITTAD